MKHLHVFLLGLVGGAAPVLFLAASSGGPGRYQMEIVEGETSRVVYVCDTETGVIRASAGVPSGMKLLTIDGNSVTALTVPIVEQSK